MTVSQNKIDDLNLELTLEIKAADYAETLSKRLAHYRRNAEFKGFRKGMVPASLIKRVYGEQCLAEAINHLVSEGLAKHIEDNKLHLLGEPITSEKQPELTWEEGNDFTFLFDAALSPELSFEVEKEDTVPSYTVTLSAKDKSSLKEDMKKFYEEKKMEFTEEELDKKVAETLAERYADEARMRLNKDIHDFYIAKSNIALPEEFLKRWLLVANEGKITKEDIDKDFDGFKEDFKWQLVRSYLMRKFEFTIDEKDLRQGAEDMVRYQYAMYGLANVPDDVLNEAVVNILQNQKQLDRLVEQLEDSKVIEKLKSEITLKATKISSTKFREL